MNRSEFMARAIIRLGSAEQHWTEHDGLGNKIDCHRWLEPDECSTRAQALWHIYSEVPGMDLR
jgi:hypothetical protein